MTSAEWQGIVGAKGPELGLSGCRVVLENKYINDVFFEGTCKGRPCIVKCSSKCPWSVANEYRLAKRLFDVAPSVVAEPLAVCGGKYAFVATAKVAGPSLAELLAKGVSGDRADSFAADILALAEALKKTGIVHRDLFEDNLLLDGGGHLKAIDFQLAIDGNDYREDPWVEKHWKFRYVVFGVNRDLGLGVWNDFYALVHVLEKLPQTDAVRSAAERLSAAAPTMSFEARPGFITRQKLRLYALSLRLQMLLKSRSHRKYPQLLRRWRTIKEGLAK